MLAVVKKPHIEVRARRIPKAIIVFLQDMYKPENVVIKDDESDSWEDTDLFKKRFTESTPGEMIFASRDMRGWSQAALAEKLGNSPHYVSDLENGRRAVSKKMAIALGKVFECDPSIFFEF